LLVTWDALDRSSPVQTQAPLNGQPLFPAWRCLVVASSLRILLFLCHTEEPISCHRPIKHLLIDLVMWLLGDDRQMNLMTQEVLSTSVLYGGSAVLMPK